MAIASVKMNAEEARIVVFDDGTLCPEGGGDGASTEDIADWIADGGTVETWATVRAMRAQLLQESDWTHLGDSPLTAEEKAAWAQYRAALRLIPQVYAAPIDVVWPTPPGS